MKCSCLRRSCSLLLMYNECRDIIRYLARNVMMTMVEHCMRMSDLSKRQ